MLSLSFARLITKISAKPGCPANSVGYKDILRFPIWTNRRARGCKTEWQASLVKCGSALARRLESRLGTGEDLQSQRYPWPDGGDRNLESGHILLRYSSRARLRPFFFLTRLRKSINVPS